MKKISGFSFVHNGVVGGYPIVEAIKAVEPYVDEMVVVDAESDDNTRDVLEALGVTILDGAWGSNAGDVLSCLHARHIECRYDLILHFEADEVYSDRLLKNIQELIYEDGRKNIAPHRIQVEQNFQRIREYPLPVHRIFPRGFIEKMGRTTIQHLKSDSEENYDIEPEFGLIWDCTNCFRDNWLDRCKQNAALWHEEPTYKAVARHATKGFVPYGGKANADLFLNSEWWTWETTPLDIPAILSPLVGQTKYNPKT